MIYLELKQFIPQAAAIHPYTQVTKNICLVLLFYNFYVCVLYHERVS